MGPEGRCWQHTHPSAWSRLLCGRVSRRRPCRGGTRRCCSAGRARCHLQQRAEGGCGLGVLAAEPPRLCQPPGSRWRAGRERVAWARGRICCWEPQPRAQERSWGTKPCRAGWDPPEPPQNPLLTLDEGRGGGPIALHLPAGAAAAGLRGHPLPLQHVGGHRGPGCLPVHPEASFTCGYGPEPSQGLTCVGTATGLRAEGSSPALLPAAESPPCPCVLPGSLVGSLFGNPAGAHPPLGAAATLETPPKPL